MRKNAVFGAFWELKFGQGALLLLGPLDPKNSFNRLPGYENPVVEKKNLELSPIEKKLVLPYQALRGRKFKMAATGGSYGGFLRNFLIWTQNRPRSWGKLRNLCVGGDADTSTSTPVLF